MCYNVIKWETIVNNLTHFDVFMCILILSILTISLICGILAITLGLSAKIEIEAMKRSTHNVQYVPLDPNWGSSDKEINELNEKHRSEFPQKDPDELEPYEINLDKMI